jgi:hypothetical protein
MKNLFTIFFIIISVINVFGQTENIESGKYHPAKEHFETEYVKQEYSKYSKSQIRIEKNKVIIDVVKNIEFPDDIDGKFKLIFENGLIDPMRVDGSVSLKVSSIDELTLLNPNPQTKRFKFWVFPQNTSSMNKGTFDYMMQNRANPDEYYFELHNESADENTNFKEFIEGAELTYLAYGGIII